MMDEVVKGYVARYKLKDGRIIDLTEKHNYRAKEAWVCQWSDPEHVIEAGDEHVRLTYRVVGDKNKKLHEKHICLLCWLGFKE